MTKELLVPIGDFESLQYAIIGGCDAVYAGLQQFSARAYAKNLSKEEMQEAIKICHLHNVKIYATVNTVIKDKEVEEFIKCVDFLQQAGIDALIMQDFGMICLVREMFPELEIHASTQTNIATEKTVALFQKLGVKRVVLPREMSLEEIEKIKIPIEKEVFIHGALCISYSGRCLMSSLIGKRSANRGECTGCCRLFYHLYCGKKKINEGYLLSTKELNTSQEIEKLQRSSITSFKIEGRMKSPLYVGLVTRFYRLLMDGKEFSYEEELDKLKILFNREFTKGHLFHEKIMNPESPNHLGLKIGKVLNVDKKKIKIKLSYPLYQEDGIRFKRSKKGFIANFIYNEQKKLISSAEKDSIIYLDNKINLTEKDDVYKTTSKKLKEEFEKLPNRKIDLECIVTAKIGKPLKLEIKEQNHQIIVEGNRVTKAKNAPLTEEQIKRQCSKLGNTPYQLAKIRVIKDENIFLPIKSLNELRRKGIEKLEEQKLTTNRKRQKVKFEKLNISYQKQTRVKVETEEQKEALNFLNDSQIILGNKKLMTEKGKYTLFETEQEEITESRKLTTYYQEGKQEISSDYSFNVTNSYTVYYLEKLGYKKVCLSVELSDDEIIDLLTCFKKNFQFIPNVEVLVYGRVVMMYCKGNILNLKEQEDKYYLCDEKNHKFPVIYQNGCTFIYSHEKIRRNEQKLQKEYLSFRYDFKEEDKNEVRKLVNP